jgi:hypothetical protein
MNAMVSIHVPMPVIAEVKAVSHLHISVRWGAGLRSGRTETLDLSPLINVFKIYKPLREDESLFRQVRVEDGGHTLVWNDDIDMSATSVERLAEESMSADEFRAFLSSNNLTQSDAAAILGYSRRQIANYLAGECIPRVVVLACYGYEARRNRPKSAISAKLDYAKHLQDRDTTETDGADVTPRLKFKVRMAEFPEGLTSAA